MSCGYQGIFSPVLRGSGNDAGHSSPARFEIKNKPAWSCMSTSPYAYMVLRLIKQWGKLMSYLYRFKITDDPTCPCQMGPQSTEHLISEYAILNKQRDTLRNRITNVGGRWPLSNSELAIKYTNLFQKFVNSVNLEGLWKHKDTKRTKRVNEQNKTNNIC
jgi:hypothetical protein